MRETLCERSYIALPQSKPVGYSDPYFSLRSRDSERLASFAKPQSCGGRGVS